MMDAIWMPDFQWQPPNIHSLPGAEWITRHRVYVDIPEGSDDWQRPFGPWQEGLLAGGKPATGWKMPSGPGEGFYKYLRKHCTKGVNGDYA